MFDAGGISYTLTIETQRLINAERAARQSLERLGNEGDKLQTRFTTMATAISAALSSIAVGALVGKIVDAQRQFDVLFASLKTMTGGAEQAGAAWERLVQFAATTPYSLEQAVQGFVKLKALGLDPSERSMTSFGNTASAMGKDLMQMIEAVADATTGEFERLKEFGIKSKVEGDKVTFTFQNVKTTIQNNALAINEYLTKIGENQFGGAMAERMKTLDGDIAGLSDSMQALYLSVSQSGFGDVVAASVQKATQAVQELTASVKQGELTEYFDRLKPVIVAAEYAAVSLAAVITGRLVAAFVATAAQAYATAAAIGAATIAARGFAAAVALMGGPVGIAVTALSLLAMNWDKVAGSAQTAAQISEDSANRIAKAQKKASDRGTKDLQGQLAEAEKGLKAVQERLAQAQKPNIYGQKSKQSVLDEYQDQADAYLQSIVDIKAALAGMGGGAGRGKINPDPVKAPPEPDKPKPKKAKKPFDQVGYAAEWAAKAASDWDKIGIDEAEAIRKNDALLKAKEISEAKHAQVLQFIREDAAKKRRELSQGELDDLIQSITTEERLQEETEARKRQKAEQSARAEMEAKQLIADAAGDPVEKIRIEEEAKLAELEVWRSQELISLQTFEDAKAAIKQKATADEQAIQDANNMMSVQMMGKATDDVLGILTKAGKERTALGKALFLANKALAVAEIIMNTEAAATKAKAQLGVYGIPVATAIRASGYISAGIVAGTAIADVAGGRAYGGPVSADNLYRVNESGAPEMYTASNGRQYMLPTANGQVTAANKVGGAAPPINIVINNTAAGTKASASYDQTARTVQITVAEVASQISNNSGPVWSALRGATNVRGAL